MIKNFKSHFHSQLIKARLAGKKKGKHPPKDTSKQLILPGEHRTNQKVGSNPKAEDAPSSSTFSGKG